MNANDDYKDPQALKDWTLRFLWAWIAVSVLALGSNALEYQLLAAVGDGFYPGDAALELRQVIPDKRGLRGCNWPSTCRPWSSS